MEYVSFFIMGESGLYLDKISILRRLHKLAFMDLNRNPWKILGEKEIYSNPWIGLTEYSVLNPAGKQGIYGKVSFKNIAIGILPLDSDLNTWLVGQYRFPLDQWSWEIPEGGGPLGTDPMDAARRELLEETGLKAAHMQELLRMHLSNSVSDEFSVTYLATGLTQHMPQPEETEELVVKKVSFEEAVIQVMEGKITDAISVAAILKAKFLLDKKQLPGISQAS